MSQKGPAPRPSSRRSSLSPLRDPGPSPGSSQLGSRGRDDTRTDPSTSAGKAEHPTPAPPTSEAAQHSQPGASRPFGVHNILNPTELRPMSSNPNSSIRPPLLPSRSGDGESPTAASGTGGSNTGQYGPPKPPPPQPYIFQGQSPSSAHQYQQQVQHNRSGSSGGGASQLGGNSPTTNQPYGPGSTRRFLNPTSPHATATSMGRPPPPPRTIDAQPSYTLPPATSLPLVPHGDSTIAPFQGHTPVSMGQSAQLQYGTSLPSSALSTPSTPPRTASQPIPSHMQSQQPRQPLPQHGQQQQQPPPMHHAGQQDATTPGPPQGGPPSHTQPSQTRPMLSGGGSYSPFHGGSGREGPGPPDSRWGASTGLPGQGDMSSGPAGLPVGMKGMSIAGGMGGEPHHLLIRPPSGEEFVVPVDYHQASKQADEKRLRNAGASARFRARKKEREKEQSLGMQKLEGINRELHQRIRELEAERSFYRDERNRLRDIVIRTPGISDAAQGPLSPPASRSDVGGFAEQSLNMGGAGAGGSVGGSFGGSGGPGLPPTRPGSRLGSIHTPQQGTPQLSHQPLPVAGMHPPHHQPQQQQHQQQQHQQHQQQQQQQQQQQLHHPPPYGPSEADRPARRRRTDSQSEFGSQTYTPSVPQPASQPGGPGPLPSISYAISPAPPPPPSTTTPPTHPPRLPPLRGLDQPGGAPSTEPPPPLTAFVPPRTTSYDGGGWGGRGGGEGGTSR